MKSKFSPIFFRNKEILLVVLILTTALSLRIIFLKDLTKSEFFFPAEGSDSAFYLSWAQDIIRGNIIGKEAFPAFPLYPYYLAFVYGFVAGGEIFLLRLASIGLGVLNCFLIYLLAKKIFGQPTGYLAALFAAGYELFIYFDASLWPTTFVISLGLLLMLFLQKVISKPALKGWFWAGVLLGICSLAKGTFIIFGIILSFAILIKYRKKGIIYGSAFLFAFLLIIAIATVRNYYVSRDFVPFTTHSGINFYIGNNPQAKGTFSPPSFLRSSAQGLREDAKIIAENITGKRLKPSEIYRFWQYQSFKFIKANPRDYFKLLGRKFYFFWTIDGQIMDDIRWFFLKELTDTILNSPMLNYKIILPLALAGIWLSLQRKSKEPVGILLLFIFANLLGVMLLFSNSRYRLLSVPLLIIFSAYFVVELPSLIKYKKIVHILLCILILLGGSLFLSRAQKNRWSHSLIWYYNLGLAYTRLGDYKRAEAELNRAISANPQDFMSHFALGNAYYKMGKMDAAIGEYKLALSLNPLYANAHYNLGHLYQTAGEYKKAQATYERVLSIDPDHRDAQYNFKKVKSLIQAK